MKVVHVKQEAFTHYIGRGWMPTVPTGKEQPLNANLGNPFVVGTHPESRAEVIAEFETWVRTNQAYMERIRALPEDAVLGCWCKPKTCHGDVIVKIWQEFEDKRYGDLERDHLGDAEKKTGIYHSDNQGKKS